MKLIKLFNTTIIFKDGTRMELLGVRESMTGSRCYFIHTPRKRKCWTFPIKNVLWIEEVRI